MDKVIVIQCAGKKDPGAGHMRDKQGRDLLFVANPNAAPKDGRCRYARPDDQAHTGSTWREELARYNKAAQSGAGNPLGLLPAWQLYTNPAYSELHWKFGKDLYILSAAWGLVKADYLLPAYDITFASQGPKHARRKDRLFEAEANQLPEDAKATLYYIGGANYIDQFIHHASRRPQAAKVIFHKSTRLGPLPDGYCKRAYKKGGSQNWHYALAKDLARGKLALPDIALPDRAKGHLSPLKSATFTDFTCIPNTRWQFSPTLNVIVGENGSGKSHLLTAIYSVLTAQEAVGKATPGSRPSAITKSALEQEIADELMANLRPGSMGELVARHKGEQAQMQLTYSNESLNIGFGFSDNSIQEVALETTPTMPLPGSPVFIPTRELLTLCPWFTALYDSRSVPVEKSWRDTVSMLGGLAVRGDATDRMGALVQPIEKAMGGRMEADSSGRFHLKTPTGHRTAAPLVAEGLRKFAMLAHLISTGALLEQGYLLWDEPEANLNPKLIKRLARALVELAQTGVQTFIATHSLFLLREISIIAEAGDGDEKPRYFALVAPKTEQGSAHLEQGDAVEDLKTLVLLDEELRQAQRYLEAHNNAHSHYNWQRKSGTR